MAAAPIFAATPRQGFAELATADTSYTAPTTTVTVLTAGSGGSRVERVRIVATGTTAAGVVNLFIWNGSSSPSIQANLRLVRSLTATIVTPSATVQPLWADGGGVITFEGGLLLPTSHALIASTTVTQTFDVTADYADF